MPGFLLEVSNGRPLLNANTVGNRTAFVLIGLIVIPFTPMRELLIQLTAGPALLLDIAIERVLADGQAKFQDQAPTDDLR